MNEHAPESPDWQADQTALANALAAGDSDLAKIAPVLAHLLGNADHELFSDEVVARVRGLVGGFARELLAAEAEGAGADANRALSTDRIVRLERELGSNGALLAHCHAHALEWQLTLRLEGEHALDPVISPLIQALIASDEPSTAALGMETLSAQARFAQAQRRMELPLAELPPELFHAALLAWRAMTGPANAAALQAAEERLREGYDESTNRLGLLERLVVAMGKGVTAALMIEHAGVALFLSALSAASTQPRNAVVVATNKRQAARMLLLLRSAGMKPQTVDEQLIYLHDDAGIPPGSSTIGSDNAAALLDSAWSGSGT